ncbi:hypothetical protein Molly5_23 [Maribacter phage Molly_5]|uniref:Uncharacterized protein n=2 Tax=Mollyvirus TaxID=2948826 RepID=A0A8E4UXZ1_9CAUD|nr:hypothetical protein M1M29_gp023 [Maribacter phage Molly_1]YP_010357271.1 hypothetical protein M1M30_gp022 [Maribacter phage Colly_1]QQO97704.1 hypothetical protein Molly2_23 [Maribacter phage Molly_2]QQO97904.1 hypothetical protein Molly3_23 [Maribacter phage Molly_3]QQO98104.1 hypothetical protein Molly4_23 [Maribacter phage Molly_4]QQO98304.1 hypothetical protein Molly5_23 [Maribacter phage Molly_5]QQO97303.1 hypothetical protein Colly1_22 [Maribacter phage Colly_1]
MCINCNVAYHGGDMASRMGVCLTTNLPVAHFVAESSIIKKASEVLGLTEETATLLAWDLFNYKNKEFKSRGDIYFCEDHFAGDLRQFFESCKNTLV